MKGRYFFLRVYRTPCYASLAIVSKLSPPRYYLEFVDAKILLQRWKYDNRSATIQGFMQDIFKTLVTQLYVI